MAVAFNTPFKALSSVGLSVGDIAALAGAGRTVGTWLRARYFDQSLLELVDIEDIIARPAIVDILELEKRWSNRMVLFQDGRILPLHEKEARDILKKVKLNRFTWIMTLFTAALHAATSQTCLEAVLLDVLTDRCQDSEGYEYLIRDLPRNIESWLSTARTRMIVRAATDLWTALGVDGLHVPGQIPDADRWELTHFILWLIGAGKGGREDKTFYTASSDVFAFAIVLQSIGMDLLQCGHLPDNESKLGVILDASRLAYRTLDNYPKRRGMRISLTNMEECVSLWPGTAENNNRLRSVFLSAMRPSRLIRPLATSCLVDYSWAVLADSGHNQGAESSRPGIGFKYCPAGRLSEMVSELASKFLLVRDREICVQLEELLQSWRSTEDEKLRFVKALTSSTSLPMGSDRNLAEIQVFLLGHYYGVLGSLVNTQQMVVREAWGSWTWNDTELFELIMGNNASLIDDEGFRETSDIPSDHSTKRFTCSGLTKVECSKKGASDQGIPVNRVLLPLDSPNKSSHLSIWEDPGPSSGEFRITFWFRPYILKLVSYLFAGAHAKQIQNVSTGCCGVKGKLTVVDSALLGAADTTAQICQFSLLDVDDTVFPSNSMGLLYGGGQDLPSPTLMTNPVERQIREISLHSRTLDFTSLVEPKWDVDVTKCQIAYRRNGRLIHRLDPGRVHDLVLDASRSTYRVTRGPGRIRFATGDVFSGNIVVEDENRTELVYYMHDRQDHSAGAEAVEMSLDLYDGCQIPLPFTEQWDGTTRAVGCVATNGLPKIRTCLASLYNQATPERKKRDGGGGIWCPDYPAGSLIINQDSCVIVIK